MKISKELITVLRYERDILGPYFREQLRKIVEKLDKEILGVDHYDDRRKVHRTG